MALSLRGTSTGPYTGGTEVVLVGSVFNTAACSDPFTGSSIGALWSTVLAGTGTVRAVAAARAAEFDTGTTAGSSVTLRTVASMTSVDAEVTFTVQTFTLRPLLTTVIGQLGLYASANETLRLRLEMVGRSSERLVLEIRQAGAVLVSQAFDIGQRLEIGRVRTLRILRDTTRVITFLNGRQIHDIPWVATAANVELAVANDATRTSRLVMRVSNYLRRAVVRFGTTLAPDVRARDSLAFATTPAFPSDVGSVSVAAIGCAGVVETAPTPFVVTVPAENIHFRAANKTLILMNDSTITKRVS